MAIVRGKRTCACMGEWFYVMEKEAIRQGIVKRSVDIYQLIGNAAASAGYHRSGAAADFKQATVAFVKLCRNMGGAAWRRDGSDGMIVHTHLVLKGCPHLTAGAKAQIPELERGGDGLVGSRRDDGPRSGVKIPLRTWKEGIAWAKAQGKPQPAPTPVDRMDPANYGPGKTGSHITWLGERLVAHGFGEFYDVGPGPVWGEADRANVRAFQVAQGWSGDDADGYPGPRTLQLLADEPRVTVPKVPTADMVEFRLSILNVAADYMSNYGGRVDNIAALIKTSRASVALICESGSYGDGALLNRHLGWGGQRGTSFVLHGGAVPVTTAIHLDPDKRRIVAEGQFITAGTINKWATWAVLEDRATKIRCLFLVTHLEYRPKGPNTVRSYDITREKQLSAVFAEGKKIATRYDTKTIVVGGDMNGDRDDPYDGPGRAAKTHGFKEFDVVALQNTNSTASTHARSGGLQRGGRIDRGFCYGPVEVLELNIFDAYPHTDHNLVASLLRVHR